MTILRRRSDGTVTEGGGRERDQGDWGRTVSRTHQSRNRLRQIETAERSLRDAIALDVTETYFSLLEAWNEIEAARENAIVDCLIVQADLARATVAGIP
jgi:hypothetical protein